ncbi:MAG: hypothetical protein ACLPTZ_11160 [Beijerinckiaceae bacterium]
MEPQQLSNRQLGEIWGITAPAAYRRVKRFGYPRALERFANLGLPRLKCNSHLVRPEREPISPEAWAKRNAFIASDASGRRSQMYPERCLGLDSRQELRDEL